MKMKKFLALLLALAMLFTLAACTKTETKDPDDNQGEENNNQTEGWVPTEPINVIVAYKAGSGTDTTARLLVQGTYASKYFNDQTFVVDNQEAGAGTVGWQALADADPDGYTIGFVNLPNFSTSITDGNVDYTVDSFAPICNHVTETSLVLVAANDDRFNTLEDLVNYGKENPGKLMASTNGDHNSNHIGAQMFANSAEFTYTAIPYGGTADQLLALRQNEADFSVAKVADIASCASEVKVLGVFNTERIAEYPDVPTLGELGYYDQWLGSSRCIVAPAGTPQEIIDYYENAFQQLMADPDYLEAASSITTDFKNAADTGALIKSQQTYAEGLADIWG